MEEGDAALGIDVVTDEQNHVQVIHQPSAFDHASSLV